MNRLVPLALLAVVACGGDTPVPEARQSTPPSPATSSVPVSPTPVRSLPPGATVASPPPPSVSPVPGSGSPAPVRAITATGTYPADQQGSESFSTAGSTPTERKYPATTELAVRGSGDERTFYVAYSPDRADKLTLRFTNGRIDLVRAESTVRIGEYAQHRSVTPSPPIPVFPADARVGQRYSGTFTSARASGNYEGAVLRREGENLVVDLNIRFTSGEATGTLRSVTTWDVARALPVKQVTDAQLGDALTTYRQRNTLTLR